MSAFAVVALLLRQEEVRVPDLTGQDIVNVINTVAQQGLQLKIDRREPHPSIPRDSVISQSPLPGSGIKKGRRVLVVVSRGPSDLQTPKLVGENFRKADIMIRQAGFIPGEVSRVSSNSAERDVVLAQDPQAGSLINRNGRISVLVSTGRKAQVFIMPTLTGKKAEEAVRAVDRLGLQHRLITKAMVTGPHAGGLTVVSQRPGPESPVAADATVDIVVSR